MATALNLVAGFLYDLIRQSWLVSTVAIKYILVLHVAEVFYREEHDLKHLEDVILKYSRLVVFSIMAVALLLVIAGIDARPKFVLLSQLTALIYYSVLFWKF